MAAAKIRLNDEVIVLTGKDKGKKGKVQHVFSRRRKAIVTGINIRKKHCKSVPEKNQPGGIIEKESFIDLSNLAVFNNFLDKGDRVRFEIRNKKKVRVFKSNGELIK